MTSPLVPHAHHGVPHEDVPPDPHAAHAVLVVASDGFRMPLEIPGAFEFTTPDPPVYHDPHGPHVPVLSAAQPAHPFARDAFAPLLPFRINFAVPVSVSVPKTYIIKPSGFSVIPVSTVRLL